MTTPHRIFFPYFYNSVYLNNFMNVEDISEYCLSKKGVEEDFPFDEETLVFKVMGKMFALIPLERIPLQINLKCEPELAVELRERYEAVQPGFHMNKKHWNTIWVDGTLRNELIYRWIDDSYNLVVKGLRKTEKEILQNK
ncbi:MAG: MmcQ/YjbR family DNA-binding protein [Ignavibacteria bacterium]|nr:MAG: MmcQ/YjbR family DNA-binding protein [Ignavibacteria bacterium]